MKIIGAGMAGLLAAAMLRDRCEAVLERSTTVPNNHSAILRFRSSIVADTLGIQFKKVKVLKAVHPWRNPIADAMAYARKTTGMSTLRSSINVRSEQEDRWIAPPDLVMRMAEIVRDKLRLGTEWHFDTWPGHHQAPTISTVPMPVLAANMNYERQDKMKFVWRNGTNLLATLPNVDAYCTLYTPEPDFLPARLSVVGDQLIAECHGHGCEHVQPNMLLGECLKRLGILADPEDCQDVRFVAQKYAKILPIDEDERRRFIMWASDTHSVYSLGRYATWRPGLLLDDVVNDVRVICRLIDGAEQYSHRTKA